MHCTGPCHQGRKACPTPTACGAILGGGNYLPREQARIEPDELDEPRDYAKAIVRAALFLVIAGCVAAVIFN